MVDSALYTNTSGAKELLRKTQLISNNLANLNTVGFHADFALMMNQGVNQQANTTRILPQTGASFTDHHTGPITYTGRELDAAINGNGFFAVQNQNGQEGLTRAGNFELTKEGLLSTHSGALVLGNAGPIAIPANATELNINPKGIISAKIKGEAETSIMEIGQIKLVNPALSSITKGSDGLFYPVDEGATLAPATDVVVVPESLEGSNVDAVAVLVEMVDMARNFDEQTKVMGIVDQNAAKANSVLAMPS